MSPRASSPSYVDVVKKGNAQEAINPVDEGFQAINKKMVSRRRNTVRLSEPYTSVNLYEL